MSSNSPLIWVTIILINCWKEVGWNAIIYLSAMAGIDPGLYEAADMDGASRLQKIWHITLPGYPTDHHRTADYEYRWRPERRYGASDAS